MSYKDVFNFVYYNNIQGFFCIINADIFLNDTINQLHTTNLANEKIMFAQFRIDYNDRTKLSSFINAMSCSQDTWFFHTNFIKNIINEIEHFNFMLGIPGCDNRILLYLLNLLGFKIINDSNFIKTHHYHTSEIRDYSPKEHINYQSKDAQYRTVNNNLYYFESMRQSKFCLCPAGDAPWSFRFYETLMCESIPIVESHDHTYRTIEESDIEYKYYLYNDNKCHIYSSDIINYNTNIFINNHLLK